MSWAEPLGRWPQVKDYRWRGGLPISSWGVPLEIRAKVFCDFSLWSPTDHLSKLCRESSHSNTEMVLDEHLQQKKMLLLFRHTWTPLFIFQQCLNKRCSSLHCQMGRNWRRRGTGPNAAWRSPVLPPPPPPGFSKSQAAGVHDQPQLQASCIYTSK